MLLERKTALITGASKGIGRAIALLFAREGADVAFTYLKHAEEAQRLAIEIGKCGCRALAIRADAMDFTRTGAVVEEVLNTFGGIDILVNNAGAAHDGLIVRMDESDWDAVISANLKSTFNYCRAVTPHMLSRKHGSIVNMSSVVGLKGNAGQCNYAAAKAGIIGLTSSLSREMGQKGIRVNAIAPGFIMTGMTADMPQSILDDWKKDIALRRCGLPEEVASVALFLASDLSSYVTGETINCSGNIKG